jgi:catechol 2,3-dioxygenase-like lactoylglutathione lyase family enzyme
MASKFTELVIDCTDPHRLAAFWTDVLGYEVTDDEGDLVAIGDPNEDSVALVFARVPEPKSVKNRVHIDLNPRDRDQAEEVERILALGATHADVGQGRQRWVVLADPEGNEFCVLRSRLDAGPLSPDEASEAASQDSFPASDG